MDANHLGQPDEFEPNEVAAYAGYDTIIQVWTVPRDKETQLAEATRLFDDVVVRTPQWPALLTHTLHVVMATWRDGKRSDFPDGISAWTSQRSVWDPLVVPYRVTEGE